MRFWLYFIVFMCVITLCISDSSSESNEDSAWEQPCGGRGRGNNAQRGGGRGRGTANTNQRGNGNNNQQRRGNGNTNQQGRSTGNNNQGRGTSNTNQQGRCTDNTNQQEQRTQIPNRESTNQQGQSPQIPNGVLSCELTCAPSTNPRRRVCGSDGVTYNTFCQLKAARCLNPDLEFESRGTCPTTSASSSEDSDEDTIQKTTVHPCDVTCAPSTNPRRQVCGSDGVTYDTFCRLKAARCINPDLISEGRGACPSSSTTPQVSDEETTQKTTQKTTVLPCDLTCAPSSNPRGRVCGSDGVTYDTFCHLKAARCFNPVLNFGSRGTCPTSSSSSSEDSDEETTQKTKVDLCDLECAPSSNPRRRVCGTDGVTYDTFCRLEEAHCVDSTIRFRARGACPDPRPESEDPTLGVTVSLETHVTSETTVPL